MNNRNGFTLVEALVATVILLIAVIGIGILFISNIKFARLNQERALALYKANSVMENLISLDYDDSCLSLGTNQTCKNDNGKCCNGLAGDESVSWNVSPGPIKNTKEITVTANFKYQDYKGKIVLNYIKGDW